VISNTLIEKEFDQTTYPGIFSNNELLEESSLYMNSFLLKINIQLDEINQLKDSQKENLKIVSTKLYNFFHDLYGNKESIKITRKIKEIVKNKQDHEDVPAHYDIFYKVIRLFFIIKFDKELDIDQITTGKINNLLLSKYKTVFEFKAIVKQFILNLYKYEKLELTKGYKFYIRFWKIDETFGVPKFLNYLTEKKQSLQNNIPIEFPGELIDSKLKTFIYFKLLQIYH
jgi:hypothetical protein